MTKSNATKVYLTDPGVYFFPKSVRVSLQVNRELLVVFRIPSIQSCGVVYFHPYAPTTHLRAMLDTLHPKISTFLKSTRARIDVKCFGLSEGNPNVIRCIRDWVEDKGLHITATDLGQQVSRKIIIHCKEGRIGVSYAETIQPQNTEELQQVRP